MYRSLVHKESVKWFKIAISTETAAPILPGVSMDDLQYVITACLTTSSYSYDIHLSGRLASHIRLEAETSSKPSNSLRTFYAKNTSRCPLKLNCTLLSLLIIQRANTHPANSQNSFASPHMDLGCIILLRFPSMRWSLHPIPVPRITIHCIDEHRHLQSLTASLPA